MKHIAMFLHCSATMVFGSLKEWDLCTFFCFLRSGLWRSEALKTRQKFEACRNLEGGAANAKIREAQKWIKDHWHPDPYCSQLRTGETEGD
jgi:hypothetical protein